MKITLIIFFLLILMSCHHKPVQSLNQQFDALENIVSSENWQAIRDKDTSYIYFSRTAPLYFQVYHYQLLRGDSVNTSLGDISVRGDSVIWNFEQKKLMLREINDSAAVWTEIGSIKNRYHLGKQDSAHLNLSLPDGITCQMKKTISLSAFLIRAKYDYETKSK